MSMKSWLASLALVFGTATLAQAAAFGDVDLNADGLITPDEFVSAYPDLSSDVWNAADADGDGVISPDEHATATDEGILPNA